MVRSIVNRRTLLAGGAVALAGGATPAAAFRELPAGEGETLVGAGCGPTAEHRELIAALESALGTRLTDTEARKVAAALSCPRCGCPVLAMLPDARADDPAF